MAGIKVDTAETAYAITSTEVKNWLRITGSDDDTVITALLIAAHNWAKEYTGRSLTTQTLQLGIDTIYDNQTIVREGKYVGIDQDLIRRNIILPFSPVASVSNVKYYDDSDNESTFAASKYYLDNFADPAKFVLRNGESYPTGLRVANSIIITYVAGYGGASDVPDDIKHACLIYTAYLFEHRGDLMDGKKVNAPTSATRLLNPYVIRTLSSHPYRGTPHFGGLM